ncbi:hypothetical protein EAO79_08475 [Plantibacter sp. PA-3-X8]|uniref:hypothetical protein n=1 Tax=Plantibacter TaxID=190323 RepID=UPI000F5E329E|nr:hypothetical protein [Plantibacter sp. PA-3-X8]AZH82929.1 hypothetical protein EAO79_08475 [Plantibacter sp. PA-3-X8]
MNGYPRSARPNRRRHSSIASAPTGVRTPLGAAIMAIVVTLATMLAVPTAANAATSGSLSVAPGASAAAVVTASNLADTTASAQFTVPAQRTAYVAVQLRAPSNAAGYRAKARILANGEVTVSISRVVAGAETSLVSGATGITVATGQQLNLEGTVSGSNPVKLSVRAWVEGTTKPSWQQSASDSSATRVSAAGPVRVWSYLSGSAGSAATIGFGKAAASTPAAAPAGSTSKPSASTTGVPSGTSLTRHDGDLTITEAGTVIDGLDIHGFVTVRAANVTIKNSIVRGGKAKGFAVGLITNYGYDNLVIDHVDVTAEFPSVYFDGIKGWDFTARNVHVVGNVDSVKIHGDNVLIEKSLLENTVDYANDPAQGGRATHNDNIQILQGQNLRVVGNTIRGASNFAILGGAEQNNVNLTVDGNWIDGGHCSLKLQVKQSWTQTAKVTNNKFGPNRAVSSCAFTSYPAVSLTQSGNTMELTGAKVNPLIVVS